VIFRIDKDGVVRAGSHARLAADTDRFIKIDNPVGTLEHRGGRTGSNAWRMSALIAARYLMRPARLRKNTDVDVFDVSPRDGKRDNVFRLARGGAGMASDTACVVDYLGPLNPVRLFRRHRGSVWEARLYHIDKSQPS
jgi:hypothetical protein